MLVSKLLVRKLHVLPHRLNLEVKRLVYKVSSPPRHAQMSKENAGLNAPVTSIYEEDSTAQLLKIVVSHDKSAICVIGHYWVVCFMKLDT